MRLGNGGESIEEIHGDVDRAVAALLLRLARPLHCEVGCQDCCIDDLTVFEVEAERIRRSVRDGAVIEVADEGRCAFLDDDGWCQVYEARPYVCRTQGLPLRWLEEAASGEWVERRDICELNEHLVALLELGEDECWTLGELEGRLAMAQARLDGGELRRISLRELARELAADSE